jgi:hypothetical protein
VAANAETGCKAALQIALATFFSVCTLLQNKLRLRFQVDFPRSDFAPSISPVLIGDEPSGVQTARIPKGAGSTERGGTNG